MNYCSVPSGRKGGKREREGTTKQCSPDCREPTATRAIKEDGTAESKGASFSCSAC